MAALEIPALPLKHEGQHYVDQHHESEFVEVEEEPYSEPQEEWEKDIPPFLRKLSTMVNDNRDAFVWKADGSLVVKNPDFLNTHLLPTYFQSIKACSFVRQLNMYGFHKVDDPTGQNPKHFEFKHPNFVPGRKELLRRIERRKTSKRSTKTEDEPSAKNNKNTAPISTNSSPSPVASPATSTQTFNNHSILEAVTKLQQQTQDNQQALMQVLGELKSYRQSHEELERKLNQYVSQQGSVRAVSPPRLIENEPQALLLVNQHHQQQQQPRQQHRPIATVNRNRLQQQQQQPLQQHPQQHHQQHPQQIHHQQQQHNGNMNAGVNRVNPNTMNGPNGMNGVPLNNNNRNMNGNVVRNVQNVVPQNNHVNYQSSANPNYYPTGIEVYSSVPLSQPYNPVYTNIGDDGSSYLASNNNLVSQTYISDLQPNIIYSPNGNEPSPISVTTSPQYSSLSDSSPSDASSSPYQDYQSPNDPNSSLSHSSSQFNYDNNQTFTSNTAGGEQIDEFVLLNLGLEDSSAQFHDFIDNNQFSSSSSSSFDPTLTAN